MQYMNSSGSIYTTITGEDTSCLWAGNFTNTHAYGCGETSTPGVVSHFNGVTYFHTLQ
jgi:hypothetical protein